MFNIANLFGVFAFVGRKNIHMDELMPPNAFLPAAQKTLHRLGEIVDIGIYGLVPATAKVVFPWWSLGKA